MKSIFGEFQELFRTKYLKINNSNLNEVVCTFKFHLFSQENQSKEFQALIEKKTNEIKIIYIDECSKSEMKDKNFDEFYIVCVNHLLIFIQRSDIQLFFSILPKNKRVAIYNRSKDIKNDVPESKLEEFNIIDVKKENLDYMLQFKLIMNTSVTENMYKTINTLWYFVRRCFLSFLIQKGFLNSKFDRIVNYLTLFDSNTEERNISKNEYIKIKNLSICNSLIYLIYHIKMEQILILKMFFRKDEEKKLFKRERKNYIGLHHALVPRYFGTAEENKHNCLIIEYLEGKSLSEIDRSKFSKEDKIKIVFQIMVIFEYLHHKNYIYRDLRLENLLIDEDKTVVLIDFDRLIQVENKENDGDIVFTNDFSSGFISPEIINKMPFSTKADIYSIGKLIEWIFKEELENYSSNEFNELREIVEKSTKSNSDERPNIDTIIDIFYHDYFLAISKIPESDSMKLGVDINKEFYFKYWFLMSQYDRSDAQLRLGYNYYSNKHFPRDINKAIYYFQLAAEQNNAVALFYLSVIYETGQFVEPDYNKSLNYLKRSADLNDAASQHNLAVLYEKGIHVEQNINKAIHYYSLAAEQNYVDSCYTLSFYYLHGIYFNPDVDKAIHYLSIAADKNDPQCCLSLGMIYHEGKFIKCDIEKAIHYYTIAANSGNPMAYNALGIIYYTGEYAPIDISKAIDCFTHAIELRQSTPEYNISSSLFYLGVIYYKRENIHHDINKAIYYFSLAADCNHIDAQYNLGVIYSDNKYVHYDIQKAIYYFTLAANNNHVESQYNLGVLLYNKEHINESIQYFKRSADQSHPKAQNNLGLIYLNGEFVPTDIKKAIYYFTLAANQNDMEAQFNLGLIYETGKFVPRDITKSIYYYTLSSNQKYSRALFYLGLIYYTNQYVKQDIDKAIRYFSQTEGEYQSEAMFFLGDIFLYGKSIQKNYGYAYHCFALSAKKNHSGSLFYLGFMTLNGLGVSIDKNKAIKYYEMAVNKNNFLAQLHLGYYYYNQEKNFKKSLFYFSLSSKQGCIESHFALASIYSEGKCIKQNIEEAIRHFKEGSSFNHQYSKNNLGIIYKNIENKPISIEYFNEAIQKTNDKLSVYNLAHIYLYGELSVQVNLDESIKLLIKYDYIQFVLLLCLAIVKKLTHVTFENMSEELSKYGNKSKEFYNMIFEMIKEKKIEDKSNFEKMYKEQEDVYLWYDINHAVIISPSYVSKNRFEQQEEAKEESIKNINKNFYEGFRSMLTLDV